MGRPTVVNNVISLATVPVILEKGAAFYQDFGLGRSRGTIPLQIAGNVKHRRAVRDGLRPDAWARSSTTSRAARPRAARSRRCRWAGRWAPISRRALFDTPFGYEEYRGEGRADRPCRASSVFDDSADMLQQARFAMEFCAIESCGKCTPCRIGAVRGVETVDRIARGDAGGDPAADRPVRHDEIRLALRAGRLHALSGDVAR